MNLQAALKRLVRHLEKLSEDARTRPKPVRTLTEAAVRGDVVEIAAFLDNGEEIDERTIGFATPLCAAASDGRLEAVRYLVEHGASLEPKEAFFPILHFPIMHQHVEVIEYLLKAGVPHEPHRALFRLSAKDRNWEVVDAMLAGGMDGLTQAERSGYDAWRTEQGSRDAGWLEARSRKVEARRAKTEMQAMQGLRLSDEDRAAEEKAAIALLREHGTSLAQASLPSGTTVLAQAATVGARALVGVMLELNAAPNPSGGPDSQPLVRALDRADAAVARMLLEAGAEPTLQACLAAASSGTLEGLRDLIAGGAKLNVRHRKMIVEAASGPFALRIRELVEKNSPG